MRVYLPPEILQKIKPGNADKNGMQEIRKPIQFVKIDGRWYFDYAAQFPELPTSAAKAGAQSPASGSPSPSTAGGSPSAASPGTVQKVTLQNGTPQEVYTTFIKALAGNDWQTQFETLASDYQTDTLMHVLFHENEGLSTLVMHPQQAEPRDKKYLELLTQHGIDLKAAAKVEPYVLAIMTPMDRTAAVKRFNELMKPVKSPGAFYTALRQFNSEVQAPGIKKQYAKCSVLDAIVNGDRATVVLRNEAHPKTSPAGFSMVLATRSNGKWFVDSRPYEPSLELSPEAMKKYLESDQQLIASVSAITQYVNLPSSVYGLAVSPDGKTFVTGGYSDEVLRFWSMETRKETGGIQNLDGKVRYLGFTADGKTLVAATNDVFGGKQSILKIDPVAKKIVQTIAITGPNKEDARIEAAALASDGSAVFVASHGGQIQRVDLAAGKVVKTGSLPRTNQFRGIAVSPDGTKLVTAQLDDFLRVWDAATLKESWSTKLSITDTKASYVSSHYVDFAPDGKLGIAIENELQIWDSATKKMTQRMIIPRTGTYATPVGVLRFSPDSQRVAAEARGWAIQVWNVGSGAAVTTLNGHSNKVNALRFADNHTLVSGGEDGTIKFWKVP